MIFRKQITTMKNARYLLLFLSAFTILFTTSGCVVSRLTETVLSIGVRDLYGDGSEICDQVIYQADGQYFAKIRKVAYKEDPAFLGLFTGMLNIFGRTLVFDDTFPESSVTVRLPDDAARYLTVKELPMLTPAPDLDGIRYCHSRIPENAIRLPICRTLPPPVVLQVEEGADLVIDAIPCGTVRSPEHWLAICLVPGAIALDVPLSVISTVLLDGYVIPAILCGRGMFKLFGTEDLPEQPQEFDPAEWY